MNKRQKKKFKKKCNFKTYVTFKSMNGMDTLSCLFKGFKDSDIIQVLDKMLKEQ